MKKKVAVIGGNGQLGSDVVSAFSGLAEVFPLTHAKVELAHAESVRLCLQAIGPDVVVNTAAMHQVEACETDPSRAFAVNAQGALHLARAAEELGALLVHISTDYVFDGAKSDPYIESDLPLPLNTYGTSKLAGEHLVRAACRRHIILRTSALYGHQPCRAKGGKNFIERMLELGRSQGEVRVVASERVSPTSTLELAQQITALSDAGLYGLFHATSEGCCSWHEFATEIFSAAGMSVRCLPAAANEFPNKVPRPAWSVLENARLKQLGLNRFRDWREGLRCYLAKAKTSAA